MTEFNTNDAAAEALDVNGAGIIRNALSNEEAHATGRYKVTAYGPKEELRDEYLELQAQFMEAESIGDEELMLSLRAEMEPMEEFKWEDDFQNLVTTAGKNDALDKYLAGSAYTAAWYLGLISSTGYTTGADAADTMGSHGGWAEDQNYSQGARPTTAWAAASAGSKALSSAASYSINASTTIKGAFLTSVATKGGTTGVLYSAGLFTNGDKVVGNGDTLNVSYTASM